MIDLFFDPGSDLSFPRSMDLKSADGEFLSSKFNWIARDKSFSNDRSEITLGKFSAQLRRAGLFDNLAVDLPGALVGLPNGVKLLKIYQAMIRDAYENAGLVEYDYPLLASVSDFDPAFSILNLRNSLLHVGTDNDFSSGSPRATLCPTGEEVIYSHWKKLISSRTDLPIQMFRHTRFFRPVTRAGCSVMKPMEAADVFEFHCAFPDSRSKDRSIDRYLQMLNSICETMQVPVFWVTRPPWGNNAGVANYCLAADALLPNGSTLQVACLYDQSTRFSKQYGIAFKENGKLQTTEHVAGAVSRRLLFANLMLSMQGCNSISLHPDIAPNQVLVLFQQTDFDCAFYSEKVRNTLSSSNLRFSFEIVGSKKCSGRVNSALETGTPLVVQIQGRRVADDKLKAIFFRSDQNTECVVFLDGLEELAALIASAIAIIKLDFRCRLESLKTRQFRRVHSWKELQASIEDGVVVIAPLSFDKEVYFRIADFKKGELLGYAFSKEDECLLSGRQTSLVGYISGRI